MKKILIFLAFIPFNLFPQMEVSDYGDTIDPQEVCGLINEKTPTLKTVVESKNGIIYDDSVTEDVLNRILSVIGASKRFKMQECSNILNAKAITSKGIRYILYNSDFMNSFNDGNNDWANLFILAHEIGHHINGHVIDVGYSGYQAKGTTDKSGSLKVYLEQLRQYELESDEFAAFILTELGAELKQIKDIFSELEEEKDNITYSTHPKKSTRLKAINIGYEKSIQRNGGESDYASNNYEKGEESFYAGIEKENKGDYYGALSAYSQAITFFSTYKKHSVNSLFLYANEYDRKITGGSIPLIAYTNDEEIKEIVDPDNLSFLDNTSPHALSYLYRGGVKLLLKDYYGAIGDFGNVTEISPNNPEAYHNRGLAKYMLKEYKSALIDYTKAIDLNPYRAIPSLIVGSEELETKEGEIYFWGGTLDTIGAIGTYFYYLNRGNAKYKLNDYRGAFNDYNMAVKIEPNAANAYYNKGLMKKELGDDEGALVEFNKAKELNEVKLRNQNNLKEISSELPPKEESYQAPMFSVKIQNLDYSTKLDEVEGWYFEDDKLLWFLVDFWEEDLLEDDEDNVVKFTNIMNEDYEYKNSRLFDKDLGTKNGFDRYFLIGYDEEEECDVIFGAIQDKSSGRMYDITVFCVNITPSEASKIISSIQIEGKSTN